MVKKEEPHKRMHVCNECFTSTVRNADSRCTLCVPHCSRSLMSAVCSSTAISGSYLRFPRFFRPELTHVSRLRCILT